MSSKIVGILNLAPDSFSDGRIYTEKELMARIQKLLEDGADIIDVGAESTAPGTQPISTEEELHRLDDFFMIVEKFINAGAVFSLDTKKSLIAKKGIEKGVSIINDVSGGRSDSSIYDLMADNPGVSYVVMYNKNTHGHADLEEGKNPDDILQTVTSFFDTLIPKLLARGIQHDQIILDPGMGSFVSTNPHDSVKILQSLSVLKKRYGLPLLIGSSRKGFLSKLSPDRGPQDRLASSIITGLFAHNEGADYLRVHDVYETRQALNIWHALHVSIDSVEKKI